MTTAEKIIADTIRQQFRIYPKALTAENLNNDEACAFLAALIADNLKRNGFRLDT